jgi:hypothetical protein
MRYVKNTMGIAEKHALEVARMETAEQANKQEKQEAKLDYIAMMADIDLSDIVDDETEDMPDEE